VKVGDTQPALNVSVEPTDSARQSCCR